MKDELLRKANRSGGLRRALRVIALALAATGVLALGFLLYVGTIGDNFRTVVPHQVFRSAQMNGQALGKLLDRERIRTVVNLRGGFGGEPDEVAACDQRGVQHVDIPLSASAFPPPGQLRKLIETFDHAAYPLLFHCQGGADRSGLAGTLYLALYQHAPLDEAEHAQLTWRYGHFPVGSTRAMDDFFDLYRRQGGGLDLRSWILTVYPRLYAEWDARGRALGAAPKPRWDKGSPPRPSPHR